MVYLKKLFWRGPTGGFVLPFSPMATGYFVDDATRAERVQQLFDTIAPRYDLINDLQSFWLHRLWKRRFVRLAQAKVGLRALDLCCGTGDVSLALADQGAEVIGLDFSQAMLDHARARDSGGSVTFQQGDALQTGLSENHFDVVTIAYGLRNLADFNGGLAEMHRVTKPGGRMLVLDFGKPTFAPWRWFYFTYLKIAVPVFGKLFCRDAPAYAYIHESLEHYPAQRGVDAALRDLGCREVKIHRILGAAMTINVAVK